MNTAGGFPSMYGFGIRLSDFALQFALQDSTAVSAELKFGISMCAGSVIATHVKNIRSKLAAVKLSPIETVWGVGYKWE